MKRLMLLLVCIPWATSVALSQASVAVEPNDAAEIRELRQQLEVISTRLAALEARAANHEAVASSGTGSPAPMNSTVDPAAVTAAKAEPATAAGTTAQPTAVVASTPERDTMAMFRSTTFGFAIDGYYGYNFNEPIGRVNLLRAYDVTSNSFNLNQVNLIVEHLPTTAERFGGRFDLQFGQATETLQGSSANEQRPQVWRNLFQAYGSYLAPVGSGLQIDFGKFASSLGNEGNYTKDQIAYSRAYSFNYLPFYHTGLRANYNVSSKLNVAYWLVNGANDTEDLNGFKSQAFLFTIKPATTLTWNVNYYFGEEARDVEPTINPGLPTSPTQPGLPTVNINPAPNGREHIFDTYATWTATPKLTLVGEADYVLNRTYAEQRPPRVVIGSLMAHYALTHNNSLGSRFEYFDDRGGLFSGTTQALKEVTFVADHTFGNGFLARAEYRRDFSNQRFFLSDTAGILEPAQTTMTLGLVYWWGTKQGSW
jgi:hypothetical protein